MNSTTIVRRAAFGVALLASAVALSATHQSGRIAVDYRDLNMSQPEAAEVLYGRIAQAARRVCQEPGRTTLAGKRIFTQCFQTALADAVARVDDRQLTALHRARTQRSVAG